MINLQYLFYKQYVVYFIYTKKKDLTNMKNINELYTLHVFLFMTITNFIKMHTLKPYIEDLSLYD